MKSIQWAVHCIDEPELEIGKPQSCNVVVNHHVEADGRGKGGTEGTRTQTLPRRGTAQAAGTQP